MSTSSNTISSSTPLNTSKWLAYETFRLGENTGGPLAISGSVWPALIEGRAPDLAQRIDEVTSKLKSGIKPTSASAISSVAPDGEDNQARWTLVLGKTHMSMCPDLPWKDQSDADRLDLLELGIAAGAYDPQATSSASNNLAMSGNPIYTHAMTCKYTEECHNFRDWVGAALFTQDTIDKQEDQSQGTLNPWYGVPGHPRQYGLCNNRFHGTDHQSVGDLLTALDKARNDSTHFTENDYDDLRQAWTKLSSDWKADSDRPREQHKVTPSPRSGYRDSEANVNTAVSSQPEANLIDLEAGVVAPQIELTGGSQTNAAGSEWSEWQGDEESKSAFDDEFGPYRSSLE